MCACTICVLACQTQKLQIKKENEQHWVEWSGKLRYSWKLRMCMKIVVASSLSELGVKHTNLALRGSVISKRHWTLMVHWQNIYALQKVRLKSTSDHEMFVKESVPRMSGTHSSELIFSKYFSQFPSRWLRNCVTLFRFSVSVLRPGKGGGDSPGTDITPEDSVLVGYRPTALVPSLHRSE